MRALPYVGVVLLWALTVAGVWFAVDQAMELGDTILEDTRTPVPGERTLELEARKYNLFFEASDISDPDRVGDALDDPDASPLTIRIREERGDRLLDLDGYSGTFTVSGGRDATAIASVRVPREGRYRVSVTSSQDLGYSGEAIVLGEPVGARVAKVIGGVIWAVLTFLSGLAALVVTLVMRERRRA
jgi:hypothetical protein